MLTAANRATGKAQEILATDSGELMVAPAGCEARLVDGTSAIPTGPCHLVGALLVSGETASELSVESDTYIKLRIRAAAYSSSSIMFPQPVNCPADLGVNLYGNGAQAIIYYAAI